MTDSAPSPTPGFDLVVLPDRFAICRLDPALPVPAWVFDAASFVTITRTPEELSLVVLEEIVPAGIVTERPYRALKLKGPLSFTLVGILAALTASVARAGISLFAISTYDTDYLFVRETDLDRTIDQLALDGHRALDA